MGEPKETAQRQYWNKKDWVVNEFLTSSEPRAVCSGAVMNFCQASLPLERSPCKAWLLPATGKAQAYMMHWTHYSACVLRALGTWDSQRSNAY